MNQIVYIVTSPELGWDCIVGVYDAGSVSKEELDKEFPSRKYIIMEKSIEVTIETE